MLGFVRSLISLACLACVAAQGTFKCGDPSDMNGDALNFVQCALALAKYSKNGGFIVDDKPSNRKSCYGCQVVLETLNGSNIYFLNSEALDSMIEISNQCPTRTGFVVDGNNKITINKILASKDC